ncbi:class D beta-lactamase [Sphingomonas sp. JC676]|uniref:class D beta-lactamase n=1 Tax=Sphingomonas sp. JC676 TaxID=2768065 RepID=UPI001CA65DDC|nr:class D beta-lactamase [Sphingomonas sp. JC676]
MNLADGKVLHRSGPSATRFTPCSTFKIPLALMGFDSGILKDAHHPAWDYRPGVHHASRETDKHMTDPTRWEAESVVWYSQELTRRLGEARFKAYVDRFGYGNRDVRGNPGKHDGLTQAWLGSSLAISPDEQVAFLRRMLAHRLVSAQAHAQAEAVIPGFEGSAGWSIRGKTGSGWAVGTNARVDKSRPLGWFIGWAEKGGRRVAFARLACGPGLLANPATGRTVRGEMLAEIGKLAG